MRKFRNYTETAELIELVFFCLLQRLQSVKLFCNYTCIYGSRNESTFSPNGVNLASAFFRTNVVVQID